MKKKEREQIDWLITIVPFLLIISLFVLFIILPEQSNYILGRIRFFLGDTFGSYYIMIGIVFFCVSIYLAGSKYGNIILGTQGEKPKNSFFSWGAMMFTCGLAADILFYSFSEWMMYASDPHIIELGNIQKWAGIYPLFHWSFIPWSFYLVLAVAFGFMLHVRNRERQKYSEACRPILGKQTDGIGGRMIDLLAVFALIAGTATTFGIATPLISEILTDVFQIQLERTALNLIILIITCLIYTYSLLHGFHGISFLAKICIYMSGTVDYVGEYNRTGDLYHIIVSIIKTLPGATIVLLAVVFTMIAFYATSFDSIALIASCYSYRKLDGQKQPHKVVQLIWCILLILFPIALLFTNSSMSNLQSVSIIAAFPIGMVMILIVISFFKDVEKYKKDLDNSQKQTK